MTAAELAKMLLKHPDWDVEVEGTSWVGCSEPERYAGSPEVDEQPVRKKFLIYAI
jgi:hypothetical protein